MHEVQIWLLLVQKSTNNNEKDKLSAPLSPLPSHDYHTHAANIQLWNRNKNTVRNGKKERNTVVTNLKEFKNLPGRNCENGHSSSWSLPSTKVMTMPLIESWILKDYSVDQMKHGFLLNSKEIVPIANALEVTYLDILLLLYAHHLPFCFKKFSRCSFHHPGET